MLVSIAMSAQASRETTYLHTDHLGTVVAATDESGSIVYRKHFDDYGDWLNTSSSVAENHPECYTGKPLLDEAGLYGSNNPVRMVDPDGNRPVEYYRVEPTYSTVSAGHLKEFYGDHGFITSASTEEDERAVEFMENAIVGGVSMIPIMRGAQLAVNATRSIRAARVTSSAFRVAQEGGRHAGQLKQFMKQDLTQLGRSIRKFDRNIAKNEKWIADPKTKISEWDTFSAERQANTIHHWQQDIVRARELQSIAKEVAKQKGH